MSSSITKLSKNTNSNSGIRIAEYRTARHLGVRLLVTFLFLLNTFPLIAQPREKQPKGISLLKTGLSERDIAETIASFKTSDPGKGVREFKKNIPAPITDPKVKKLAFEKVDGEFGKFRVRNPLLEKRLRALISQVLKLYGRENAYDLYVFKNRSPYIINQSGVMLVMTTGLLKELSSDDELLGLVAHEVGHDYFAEYSKYSEHLFLSVYQKRKESAFIRHFAHVLAILELHCDAFASITLEHLGYNPTAFTSAVIRMNEKFPVDPEAYHPKPFMRKRVASSVIPATKEKQKKKARFVDASGSSKASNQIRQRVAVVTLLIFLRPIGLF